MANVVSGLDLAWGSADLDLDLVRRLHPNVAVLTCYLAPQPNSKCATSATLVRWLRAGFAVKLNWEWYAGRALEGADAGTADARAALAQARAHLAYITDHLGPVVASKVGIDFSCDTNVSMVTRVARAGLRRSSAVHGRRGYSIATSQHTDVIGYYQAAARVLRPAGFLVGAYAERDVLVALFNNLTIDTGWQTYAWSAGQFTSLASFYQWSNSHKVGAVSVDYDQVIDAARLGAIWPAGLDPNQVHHPAPPTPIVIPEGTITVTDSKGKAAPVTLTTNDLAKLVREQVAAVIEPLFSTDEDPTQTRRLLAHLKYVVHGNPYGPTT